MHEQVMTLLENIILLDKLFFKFIMFSFSLDQFSQHHPTAILLTFTFFKKKIL
jgi:hypothetical protein